MHLGIAFQHTKVLLFYSYVEFLRRKQSNCYPGSKMQVAVEYILQRDKARAANQPTSNSTPHVPTKREWTPSTRSRFNQAASGYML